MAVRTESDIYEARSNDKSKVNIGTLKVQRSNSREDLTSSGFSKNQIGRINDQAVQDSARYLKKSEKIHVNGKEVSELGKVRRMMHASGEAPEKIKVSGKVSSVKVAAAVPANVVPSDEVKEAINKGADVVDAVGIIGKLKPFNRAFSAKNKRVANSGIKIEKKLTGYEKSSSRIDNLKTVSSTRNVRRVNAKLRMQDTKLLKVVGKKNILLRGATKTGTSWIMRFVTRILLALSGAMGAVIIAIVIGVLVLTLILASIANMNTYRTGSLTGEAAVVYAFLKDKGMEDLQAAAIMGNIKQESSMIASLERTHIPDIGLFQYTKANYHTFIAYCNARGLNKYDATAQLEYFWINPDTGYGYATTINHNYGNYTGWWGIESRERFEATDDLDKATEIFYLEYEGPGSKDTSLPKRQEYAHQYYLAMQNMTSVGSDGFGYQIPAEALSDQRFLNMITEANKYLGYPYVWGGASPSTSFDCSGFVSWVINHCGNGWDVGRLTAEGLRSICAYVPPGEAKPGDLIFFQGTYATSGASHVGIYVGDGMMVHCGNPIQYASINTSYWQAHFLAYGRISR